MRITRRNVLVGGASLGALSLVGCDTGAKNPTDTGAAEPTPERAPEPEAWAAPGTEDAAAFAWGVQVGDATPTTAIVSVRTPEQALTLVVMEADGEGWIELERQEGLVPDEGVLQVALEGLVAESVYAVVAYAADGERRSPVARFRTALGAEDTRIVTFGAVSCIAGNQPWPSLTHAAAAKLDFFCLLGDTVYVDYGDDAFDYESKWRTALATKGLRDVTASTSIIATWDDHEVANNYAFDEPGIEEKFADGLVAFRRALPQSRGPGGTGIWRKLSWGAALDVFALDCRGERRDGNYISTEQMAWLKAELSASTARFKILLNSVPITDLTALFGPVEEGDRWQGHPDQRAEILGHIRDTAIPGVLWVSGDVHFANIARIDPAGGIGEDQWEVFAGPGGSTPNYLVDAYVGGTEQYAVMFAQWNYARFTCDPGKGTILVTYIGDDGAVIEEMELSV